MRQLDKGGINYRKEVWAILKEYEKSKVMTLEEVLDRITALTELEAKKQKGKVTYNIERTYFP